jgi:hypothetical protein
MGSQASRFGAEKAEKTVIRIGQTGGFDLGGIHQFDLSGILLRPLAGNAKQSSSCQPRVI